MAWFVPEGARAVLDFVSKLDWSGGDPAAARLDSVRRGLWISLTARRPPVGQTPHSVVHTHDKLTVRYYDPGEAGRGRLPVIVVPSMINRATILDLEPGRSLVAGLRDLGHPVYLIDWGVPDVEDADEDVAYVLLELLDRAVRRCLRHAGAERAHVFGYCMGGTLAALYASLRGERLASLATLAAPVHFEGRGGRFGDFVDAAHLDVERAFADGELLEASVMEPTFKLLAPMGLIDKYVGLDVASRDPASLRRALARERWLEDNVPLPGAFAREFIAHTYQRDALVHGGWSLGGEAVSLRNITCPTLVVSCERDFISPAPACEPLAELVGSEHVRLEKLPTGHIGAVVGSMGPKAFYPLLDQFFRDPVATEAA